jgi:hypothetical protein
VIHVRDRDVGDVVHGRIVEKGAAAVCGGFPATALTNSALRPGPVVESQNNFLVASFVAQKIVLLEVLEAEFLVAQKNRTA